MDDEMLINDEINHKDEISTYGLNELTHWWNFFQEWIFYTQEKFTIVMQLTVQMKKVCESIFTRKDSKKKIFLKKYGLQS
jgi:hypothetical protein